MSGRGSTSKVRPCRWYAASATSLVLAACLCGAAEGRPREGDAAPAFAGYTADGPIDLSAFRGRVVVLSFWASWCGPCMKELPMLEGLQKAAGRGRLQVVAINIEPVETYRQIARKLGALQITVASDAGHEAQSRYGVNGIPHMVIVDRDGRIVRVHRGYSDAGVDDAIADLNRVLGE